MEVLDGWITGVFLGSSREEETANKLLCHIKYTNIMWGLGG